MARQCVGGAGKTIPASPRNAAGVKSRSESQRRRHKSPVRCSASKVTKPSSRAAQVFAFANQLAEWYGDAPAIAGSASRFVRDATSTLTLLQGEATDSGPPPA
jgi:hypothetical protein